MFSGTETLNGGSSELTMTVLGCGEQSVIHKWGSDVF
jgi:hypothetical protein